MTRMGSLQQISAGRLGRTGFLGSLTLVPQTPALLTCGRETTEYPALVLSSHDPLDLGIVLDHRMEGIHKNDLVIFVTTVLAHPIGVQDLKIWIMPAGTLLCDTLDGFGHGDLADTLSLCSPSMPDGVLPHTSAPDSRSHNNVALLCFVAQPSGSVQTCWMIHSDDCVFLTPLDLPLPVKLFEIAFPRNFPCVPDIIVHIFCHGNHFPDMASLDARTSVSLVCGFTSRPGRSQAHFLRDLIPSPASSPGFRY